jgi:hypothetical protein
MAAGPWRCSQCGTVNEPVATSCRTCGRWPSLFDLEASVVDEAEPDAFRQTNFESEAAEPDPYRADTVEPEAFDPETFRTDTIEPEPVEPVHDGSAEPETEPESGARRWARFIVPIAVLIYFAISFFFSDR